MVQKKDKTKPIVLIVDDQYQTFRSLPRLISPDLFSSTWVPDEQQGLKILKDQTDRVHIIIIDLKSSGMGGGGFLHRARKIAPHAAILITAPLGPFLYQEGAFYDFSGPSLKHDINTILLSIVQKMGIDHEPEENKGQPHEYKERFGVIIGQSKGINEVYHLIEKLNDSSATVMIQGESGTGKELVAQTIHQTSSRGNGPFVAINCGAIPANLMESELFGHERGAFTTAVHQRKGKFEFAHGGTLFLDDSQDLRRAVQAGHFRDDLFYRLNVVPIHIPPLRERREDIPLLLDHFFHKIAKEMDRSVPFLTEEAISDLLGYSYHGNVRELTNIVERLLVTCPNGKITHQDLPEEVREEAGPVPASTDRLRALPHAGVPLQEIEKELILKTLKMNSWNKAATARMLGITRRLLYLRLSQYSPSAQ
jgi:DNA-binding NtrC family response regulator